MKFRVATLNTRGIAALRRRIQLCCFLKEHEIDVCFLQETNVISLDDAGDLCHGYSAVVAPATTTVGSGLACVFAPGVVVHRQQILWPGEIAVIDLTVRGVSMTRIDARRLDRILLPSGFCDRVTHYQTIDYAYSDHRAVLIQVGDPAPTRLPCIGKLLRKSCGLWCGSWRHRTDSPLGIFWTSESLNILGCTITAGNTIASQASHLMGLLERAIARWSPFVRGLSLVGSARAANCLVLGSILHHLHGYVPPETTIGRLQARLARFVWGTSRVSWLPGDILARPVSEGGVGLLVIAGQLRLSCLKGVQASLRGAANGNSWLETNKDSLDYAQYLCLGYSAIFATPAASRGSGLACLFVPGVALLRHRVLWPGCIDLVYLNVHGQKMAVINCHLSHAPHERLEQVGIISVTAVRDNAWVVGDLNIDGGPGGATDSASVEALSNLLEQAALEDAATFFNLTHLPTRVADFEGRIHSSRLDRILLPAALVERAKSYST
ncbi:hypothetical protein LAZ67_11002225 [Cordylochernes scorpioides]|uniref:Endonuclease/exonuclease/phosphatase domain-containing protein n=1 Tax=Cordylochernes scorpioides TaxID=51811 RepID=A0ABY6KZ33_9ARAC|nr:hypothetical protein LAZ67_11002225 [Cordylochernes scorpioides]